MISPHVPYGKQLVDGKPVDCPRELEVLKITRDLKPHTSFRVICGVLNERGYRTRTGKEFKQEHLRYLYREYIGSDFK